MLDTLRLQNALSVFEVNGRQHAIVGVLALGVIEHLDIFEDVLPCGLTGGVGFPPDPFPLQQLEKALSHSVIMAVATAAHAGFQIVLTPESLPLAAGILRTLVGVNGGLAPPDRHQQGLQSQVGCHA